MGNVEVVYGVFIQSLCMLSSENRLSLISTRKYKKSVHNLNNFPLLLLVYIFLLPGISRQQTIFLSDLRFFVPWFHGSIVNV